MNVQKEIEPNLYGATAKTYRKAVDEGFGRVEFGHPDYDFVQALKTNTDVLAAFKTHRQQNDIASLMLDENGKLKPFDRFRQDVEGVIGKYNRNWLRTEYNTAVIRARHAARWKDFERDADLFPNLKWLESTSPNPDKVVHIRFWNRIWAMVDPFWKSHYPGDRWNCKCGITNTDEPVTNNDDLSDDQVFKTERPDAGIDSNPGISGEIFTRSHPYVKEAYKGADEAVKKLGKKLKVQKERRKEIAKQAAALKEETLTHPEFSREIQVTGKSIKEWLNQPHEHYPEKNELLPDIQNIIARSQYLGWTPYHKGNVMYVKSHIFEIVLGGSKSWIIVREDVNGTMLLYSISDSDKVLTDIKK